MGTPPITLISPAYNIAASCKNVHGNPVQVDGRGVARSAGLPCDLGAYEVDRDPIFADGFEVP